MADLTLNIKGDASGASDALREAGGAVEDLGNDVGKSVVKWQELVDITKAAVTAVVKFGVDAVKAYADSERVQKQLTRAAGQYAEALGEQAEAMSKVYAVDDDIIKQSQILLTQWGGVGAASEEVTKAVLDYAAATGQDAVAATQDLIRNVESGGVGLAKMGVHFTATGDKGKDLAGAVDALSKKFGGAAAADAASLHGSLAGVNLAFNDLVKDLGESITTFLQQTGAVDALTQALRNMREFIGGKDGDALIKEGLRQADLINAQKELAYAQSELNAAMMEGQSQTILDLFEQDVINAQAKLDKLLADAKKATLPGITSVTGQTNKGGKDQEAAAAAAKAAADEAEKIRQQNIEDMRKYQRGIDELDEHARERDQKAMDDFWRLVDEEEKARQEKEKLIWDSERRIAKIEDDARAEREKKEQQALDDRLKEMKDRAAQQEKEFKATADAIGGAFVNALADQLSKLAEGGEFDVAMFVGEILASVIAIAGSVIGSAYGQPALGAAIGNLAAMGVRMGASAISSSRKKGGKKYHEGGWVGDEAELPRYHSGTWVGSDERPAILQTGERVLSRLEVNRMGGQAGVDAAARGKPAVNVYLSAIDSKSAADSFVSDLGDGLRDALRRGRGSLAPLLLGASPR